jgi:uncharacterized protein
VRWRGRRQSENIEDRRGRGGFRPTGFGRGARIPVGRAGGGIGIGGLIVLVVVMLVFGINPIQLLEDGPVVSTEERGPAGQAGSGSDEMRDFVAVVLAETEEVWTRIFAENGQQYREPTLVLFSGQVRSACGFAGAASGPFYCPADERLYIDLAFYEELRRRFRAPGDFAQAYVIAHEVGHHVQNLLGTLSEFHRQRQALPEQEANQLSVRVELQADCFAGIWASRTDERGLLEEGDIDEALNAAAQIGDDMIQRRTQGYVVPEAFNHGSSQQRRSWFARGFEAGSLEACDTFGASRV